MTTLVIATKNTHKVVEIRAILGGGFRYQSLNDLPGAPEVIEDAGTFAGNASKKAVALAHWLANLQGTQDNAINGDRLGSGEMFVLADDSGLEVDALDGAPGVHSARFAALDTGQPGNSATADNNAKLLRLLEGVPVERRMARFRCVIALTPVTQPGNPAGTSPGVAGEHQVRPELFEGACEGRIEPVPRGRGGFGYDPLFVPDGFAQTFGELPETTKNRLSHRARALEQLKQRLPGS